MENYVSKAQIITIKATSRASVKVRDNFYTIEYGEERTVPNDANLEMERTILWDTVNNEVDSQIEDIVRTFKK